MSKIVVEVKKLILLWYSCIINDTILFPAKKKDLKFTVNFTFGTSHGLKIQIILSEADAQFSWVYSNLNSLCPVTTANLTKTHQPRHLQENVRDGPKAHWALLELYADIPWSWTSESLPSGLVPELPILQGWRPLAWGLGMPQLERGAC